jgi:Fungal Zn(2)-Cys(6) binuclear cluster domain
MAPSPNNSYVPAAGIPPSTPSYYPANQSTQQNHESPAEDSPSANPNDPNDLKRPRACEACRQLKVKCEPDDSSPTGSCKRCAKANRQCLVTAPSRKRQKKTDSRVAELEKKIDALTATLAAKGGADPDLDHGVPHHLPPPHTLPQHPPPPTYGAQWSGAPPPPPPPTVHVSPQQNLNQQQHHGVKRKMSGYDYFGGELQRPTATTTGPGAGYRPPMPQPPHFGGAIPSPIPRIRTEDEDTIYDPITHAAMDTRTVKKCWDRYNHDMCHHLPIVVFPEGLKWEDLRKTKPILFLAIVAVASGTIRPDLQGKLLTEVTKVLADRIVYRGEKSLELVQTIQTMTTFYQPPEKYEELNFNQLIHIAAVMALDIGLGKRFKKGNVALWRSYTEQKRALPDPNSAETRRCWLGCYYMCSK